MGQDIVGQKFVGQDVAGAISLGQEVSGAGGSGAGSRESFYQSLHIPSDKRKYHNCIPSISPVDTYQK